MNIIFQSREFTKAERYLLTLSPDAVPFKAIPDGTSFPVKGYLIFEDDKQIETGETETSTILSILTETDGNPRVYAGQSPTLAKSLQNIETVMEGDPFNVIKFTGKSKKGREYVDCKLDISGLK